MKHLDTYYCCKLLSPMMQKCFYEFLHISVHIYIMLQKDPILLVIKLKDIIRAPGTNNDESKFLRIGDHVT